MGILLTESINLLDLFLYHRLLLSAQGGGFTFEFSG